MPLPKPLRGTLLNHSHPLARGLVGVWLMNEGGGNKILDATGNPFSMTIQMGATAPTWSVGNTGSALLFNDANNQYSNTNSAAVADYPLTLACWFNADDAALNLALMWIGDKDVAEKYCGLRAEGAVAGDPVRAYSRNTSAVYADSTTGFTTNKWHLATGVFASSASRIAYIDGGSPGSNTSSQAALNWDRTAIGYFGDLTPTNYFSGKISVAYIWNRALTATEVARLYREPFAMFEPARGVGQLYALGQDVWLNGSTEAQSASSAALKRLRRLAGSAFAQSQASAVCKITRKVSSIATSVSDAAGLLKATRKIAASVGGLAAVNGTISVAGEILLTGIVTGTAALSGMLTLSVRQPWFSGSLEIERQWLREALFNCITTNALKLGTVLTMGWFWVRVSGCSALYRGAGMGEVDFTNILALAAQAACEIQPPVYLPHYNNSTYFYVIRRFNNCGCQERTLGAAVKVSIDAGGELIRPQPNNIFGSKAEQVNGNKIQLVWFYCPLEQKSKPACFKIYWDSRTGQVGYENPAAIISYEGRKYYSYKTGALEAGRYLSAIRVEDAEGVADNSIAQSRIELHTKPPDSIAILSAGTV